ncbi:hypothetical protein BDY17DRAFT_161794 [Neohortaea acidophila]|uniref:Hydrophobin n=1 Tax=Neohortaea acidophila TaxID=245834 RepID=A0A6A6PR19_9PEZI|nr:uncharacterized protein BDY17DRAFT_161794 [Neohortaea acidophila]KAF2482550.1 hypothetical protein BDY17DRAFT_161794 [Neohortaea acidophila]
MSLGRRSPRHIVVQANRLTSAASITARLFDRRHRLMVRVQLQSLHSFINRRQDLDLVFSCHDHPSTQLPPKPHSLHHITMHASSALTLLCTVSVAVAAVTPKYGAGGKPPKGWNANVENFCSSGQTLMCCGQVTGGVAGLPAALCSDAVYARAGTQQNLQYGFCPMKKTPLCCGVVVNSSTGTGCGPATQVKKPASKTSSSRKHKSTS